MEVIDGLSKRSSGWTVMGVVLWENGQGDIGDKVRSRAFAGAGMWAWEGFEDGRGNGTYDEQVDRDGKLMSHREEGRIARAGFLSMREWVTVHKWRLAFARSTDLLSKRTGSKAGMCLCWYREWAVGTWEKCSFDCFHFLKKKKNRKQGLQLQRRMGEGRRFGKRWKVLK